jgi:hypothetical protein
LDIEKYTITKKERENKIDERWKKRRRDIE